MIKKYTRAKIRTFNIDYHFTNNIYSTFVNFSSMSSKLHMTFVTLKFVDANLLRDANMKSWLAGCCLTEDGFTAEQRLLSRPFHCVSRKSKRVKRADEGRDDGRDRQLACRNNYFPFLRRHEICPSLVFALSL